MKGLGLGMRIWMSWDEGWDEGLGFEDEGLGLGDVRLPRDH